MIGDRRARRVGRASRGSDVYGRRRLTDVTCRRVVGTYVIDELTPVWEVSRAPPSTPMIRPDDERAKAPRTCRILRNARRAPAAARDLTHAGFVELAEHDFHGATDFHRLSASLSFSSLSRSLSICLPGSIRTGATATRSDGRPSDTGAWSRARVPRRARDAPGRVSR